MDYTFLEQGAVGVLNPLPRTPDMYEGQTSWKLEDDLMEELTLKEAHVRFGNKVAISSLP